MDGIEKKSEFKLFDPKHKEALERFAYCEQAESKIRKKGLEDDRFYAGEQWPDAVRLDRETGQNPRPCLTINLLPGKVKQVTNDARQNRPSIKIAPVEDSDEEIAEIFEGMCRHIEVASDASVAYDTALESSVRKGWGYFRVVTEYEDENSFNQVIRIKPIKNSFTVYVDPMAQNHDYSDARFMFITEDVRKEDLDKQDVMDLTLSSTGDKQSGWMNEDAVRIAEYWAIEDEEFTLCLLEDGTSIAQDELDAFNQQAKALGQQEIKAVKTRPSTRKKVIWRKMNGAKFIEETEWAGKYIPIIPVLGDELDLDGEKNLIGMVRAAKDPQRMYNYWSSAATEAVALAPKAPFIAAAGQIEGYERYWETANSKNWSHLPYNPIDVNGTLVGAPHRQQAEPAISAMMAVKAQAADDIKATTGIYDASLGARSNETTGRAIIARQHEGDVGNFHYIDNLSRSIRHLATILVDLIPKIYDTGRVIRILEPDGEARSVKVNEPFEDKDENGNAITKIYDLNTGKFDISVQTGPSYATKRMQAADSMAQILQGNPQLWSIAGDILARNLDWPGAEELADRMKKMLPPQLQDKQEGQQQDPQAKAQLDQAHQMIEQLTKALNDAHDKLDAKSAELESKEKIAFAKMQNDTVNTVIKTESANNQALMGFELQHLQHEKALQSSKPMEMPEPQPQQTQLT